MVKSGEAPMNNDKDIAEALDILSHIVSQANVNYVEGEDGFIKRYDMPVGSIHRAIPFLHRYGIVVNQYGKIHRARHAYSPNSDSDNA